METKNSNLPIYIQIYDVIKKRIANYEYPVGEFLPTEMELMKEFNVSRVTIRKTLDKLAKQNFIKKKAGYGTIVLKRENVSNFTMVRSNFSRITEMSSMYKTLSIDVDIINPTSEQVELFHMNKNDKLYRIERIRGNYKKRPVIISYIYLKSNIDFTEKDVEDGLYSFLEENGIFFTEYHEHITAVMGEDDQLRMLRINTPSALLKRTRFSYCDGNLIEYTINYYNPLYYEYRTDFTVNNKNIIKK